MQRAFIAHVEELIPPESYAADPAGRAVRLRIEATEAGVRVLGDAVHAAELEALLGDLDPEVIQQMLCW